ncbi:MAG: RsmB/NOP family class I SAM-dependent RNA methyltransferase [Alphaproteobacteria bacterium]|nr:RsmB/NOP family class I SAM-dependent RNA methyltransferase [Alphaproteobacteria bacterium]
MTPAARLQAAIEILDGLNGTALPADRFIRDWFRKRRYAGSKDRVAVAERVFDVLRHRNAFAWRMQSEAPRALVIASLLQEGQTADSIHAFFRGEGYGPPPLTEGEIQAIASPPRGEPPSHVRREYPQWLEPELQRGLGEYLPEEMLAMRERAPIDLRVNTLKATRSDVLQQLREDGFDAESTRYSPVGIRIPAGARGLEKTALFEAGAFELQDEASQIAALMADPKPGMRVLDLAAGTGGKSLAMAAQMRNEGEIVATDVDAGRLRQLAVRAERAGVKILLPGLRGGEGATLFDRVLVDAPCSGTGTWRRQPELRWRLTAERLEALRALQAQLLEEGARHTKPGSRLIYATCSVLPCENEDQIAAFLARHTDFVIRDARGVWSGSQATIAPPGAGEFYRATPLVDDTDGFFAAVLERMV